MISWAVYIRYKSKYWISTPDIVCELLLKWNDILKSLNVAFKDSFLKMGFQSQEPMFVESFHSPTVCKAIGKKLRKC